MISKIFSLDFEKASVSEQVMFSTVRIQTITGSGLATGTGFIYKFITKKGSEVPLLITNKHVIENYSEINVCFHEADLSLPKPSGKLIHQDLLIGTNLIISHPDPGVDLCAIYLAPTIKTLNSLGKRIFYVSLDKNVIPSEQNLIDLKAIEDVTMFGYPLGLWDSVNNLPIMRKGITATHPMVNFQNKQISVIDLACFPGSSGSPVFIMNEGMYSEKNGTSKIGTRLLLLGILFGGPVMTAEGKIVIKEIPTQSIPTSYTQLMIHLGYIVKASALEEILNIVRINNQDI